MRPIYEPSREGLQFWVVMALAAAGTVLWWGLEAVKGAPAPRAARAPLAVRLTDDQVAGVIACQVHRQPARSVRRRMARYYNAEQIRIYARAVRTGLEAQDWSPGLTWRDYVPVMLATVDQQSRWQHDAVSQWNTDGRGVRIKVHPRTAWSKPNYSLDYGLGQPHWGWAHKRVDSVEDLKDPATNLKVLGWWFARRAHKCIRHYEAKRCKGHAVRGNRDCDRQRKCLLTRKVFGVPGYAGTTDNLVRTFAPPMWRCIERVLSGDWPPADGEA